MYAIFYALPSIFYNINVKTLIYKIAENIKYMNFYFKYFNKYKFNFDLYLNLSIKCQILKEI